MLCFPRQMVISRQKNRSVAHTLRKRGRACLGCLAALQRPLPLNRKVNPNVWRALICACPACLVKFMPMRSEAYFTGVGQGHMGGPGAYGGALATLSTYYRGTLATLFKCALGDVRSERAWLVLQLFNFNNRFLHLINIISHIELFPG